MHQRAFLPPKNATRALSATKKCHQSPFCPQKMPPEPFLPPKNATREEFSYIGGRGSTAHAQTSPCYSIGAFIKCASKSLFATKKCHQSPFCHQKMPPEPFLPPKNATRALSATKKCHQRGIILHRGRGSTAHAQTSPCYSIGAFIKYASKSLFATKKCHQSPFCHQKMPPEPFLPPKNATREE